VVDAVLPDARSPDSNAALDRTLDRCLATDTTALLVHADADAIALVQRCEDRQLTVPGDLSIVAYDDEVAGLVSRRSPPYARRAGRWAGPLRDWSPTA
jgi:DNA-binding LacI/PurR family transcriptional regulator